MQRRDFYGNSESCDRTWQTALAAGIRTAAGWAAVCAAKRAVHGSVFRRAGGYGALGIAAQLAALRRNKVHWADQLRQSVQRSAVLAQPQLYHRVRRADHAADLFARLRHG